MSNLRGLLTISLGQPLSIVAHVDIRKKLAALEIL
jgi:hypothetical protein